MDRRKPGSCLGPSVFLCSANLTQIPIPLRKPQCLLCGSLSISHPHQTYPTSTHTGDSGEPVIYLFCPKKGGSPASPIYVPALATATLRTTSKVQPDCPSLPPSPLQCPSILPPHWTDTFCPFHCQRSVHILLLPKPHHLMRNCPLVTSLPPCPF